jgi:hypothetical protein
MTPSKRVKTLTYLQSLFNDKNTSDLVINFNNTNYYLHKIIIMQIPYFQSNMNFNKLSDNKDEFTLSLNVDNYSFELLIKSLYEIDIKSLVDEISTYEELLQIYKDIHDLYDYFIIVNDSLTIILNTIILKFYNSFIKDLDIFEKSLSDQYLKKLVMTEFKKNEFNCKNEFKISYQCIENRINTLIIIDNYDQENIILSFNIIGLLISNNISKETIKKIIKFRLSLDSNKLEEVLNKVYRNSSIQYSFIVNELSNIKKYCVDKIDNL